MWPLQTYFDTDNKLADILLGLFWIRSSFGVEIKVAVFAKR